MDLNPIGTFDGLAKRLAKHHAFLWERLVAWKFIRLPTPPRRMTYGTKNRNMLTFNI